MKTQNSRILPLALALAALALNLSAIQQAKAAGFVSVSPMNMQRSRHTATLLPNGKVLVADFPGARNSAELYDPATDTWTVTGSMNFGGMTATLLPNGKVLVAGAAFNPTKQDNTGTSAELYDPATGTWTLTGSLHNSTACPRSTGVQSAGSPRSQPGIDTPTASSNCRNVSPASLRPNCSNEWNVPLTTRPGAR